MIGSPDRQGVVSHALPPRQGSHSRSNWAALPPFKDGPVALSAWRVGGRLYVGEPVTKRGDSAESAGGEIEFNPSEALAAIGTPAIYTWPAVSDDSGHRAPGACIVDWYRRAALLERKTGTARGATRVSAAVGDALTAFAAAFKLRPGHLVVVRPAGGAATITESGRTAAWVAAVGARASSPACEHTTAAEPAGDAIPVVRADRIGPRQAWAARRKNILRIGIGRRRRRPAGRCEHEHASGRERSRYGVPIAHDLHDIRLLKM